MLMRIRDQFADLCVMVPIDENCDMHDPNVPWEDKKWVLLRAPWQDPLPNEHLIPAAPELPPRGIVDRYNAVFSQWFFKNTMAAPCEQ